MNSSQASQLAGLDIDSAPTPEPWYPYDQFPAQTGYKCSYLHAIALPCLRPR